MISVLSLAAGEDVTAGRSGDRRRPRVQMAETET